MFEQVQVFSETKYRERNRMGSAVTQFLIENSDLEVVDKVVSQSSDSEYHCLSITLFLRKRR